MRLTKKVKKRLLLVGSILLILAALTSAFISYRILHAPHSVVVDVGEKKPIVIKRNFSFIAVGDALIHDEVYNDAKTTERDEAGYPLYDFKSMFTDVKEIIKDYDLKFYNQETIIGGKAIGLSSYPSFNSPDEIGLDLIDTGFNIVNLATNHTLDRGEKAMLYSRNFWKNQTGVLTVGSYDSKEDQAQERIQEKNGITYAVFGYTTVTNGQKVPAGKDYLLNVYDKEKVKKDIESVRSKVDIVIVSMHWGEEYTHTPIASQKEIATYLSSLGVDVIIGHHPHVIEPVEFIDDTLVIYSLGNFISAQEGTMKRVGMIAAFDVYKETTREGSKVEIQHVKTDLLWTNHENNTNFKVIPLSKVTETQLKNHEKIYEQYKKYINPKEDGRIQIGFIK